MRIIVRFLSFPQDLMGTQRMKSSSYLQCINALLDLLNTAKRDGNPFTQLTELRTILESFISTLDSSIIREAQMPREIPCRVPGWAENLPPTLERVLLVPMKRKVGADISSNVLPWFHIRTILSLSFSAIISILYSYRSFKQLHPWRENGRASILVLRKLMLSHLYRTSLESHDLVVEFQMQFLVDAFELFKWLPSFIIALESRYTSAVWGNLIRVSCWPQYRYKSLSRGCPICMFEEDDVDFVVMRECRHVLCTVCWSHRVEDNTW